MTNNKAMNDLYENDYPEIDTNTDSIGACILGYDNRDNITKYDIEKFDFLWFFQDYSVTKYIKEVEISDLQFLIDNGAKIKGEGLFELINMTPNREFKKFFISNCENVNFKDSNGDSILMKIMELNLFDESDLLDEIACEFVQIREDIFGKMSCFYDDEMYVAFLNLIIDCGADINSKNNIGMTPLMKYALHGKNKFVQVLLQSGADINAKSEMTAFDMAQSDEIRSLIQESKNNNPQRLVKLLSNFTIDKPIKYTTHTWDFGELKKEYGSFEGYMNAVKKQFESMEDDLKNLSPNLYEKIRTFLIEENPNKSYSWCHKAPINLGWSSVEGLKEWCDSGKNAFDFKLQSPVFMGRKQIATFGEVIDLFKQEIEIRSDFKNLEMMIQFQNIALNLSSAKLSTRQFYTDTQKISTVLNKIFSEMKKRTDHMQIVVITTELEDRSIELRITQIDSFANKKANELLEEVKDGDFFDIKENLTNLCDWSIEGNHENENFRVNYLHSNNVKDIEILDYVPKGFTHILRFYK